MAIIFSNRWGEGFISFNIGLWAFNKSIKVARPIKILYDKSQCFKLRPYEILLVGS